MNKRYKHKYKDLKQMVKDAEGAWIDERGLNIYDSFLDTGDCWGGDYIERIDHLTEDQQIVIKEMVKRLHGEDN